MRTTVTLDPDVESLLRKFMRERGLSFKEALNESVRSARSGGLRPRAQKPFVQKTYKMGFRPEFNWDKAMTIADAMEDEEIIRKMQLRK